MWCRMTSKCFCMDLLGSWKCWQMLMIPHRKSKNRLRAPSKSATVTWLTAQTLPIREQEEPHPLTPNYHFLPVCCCLFTNPGTKQDVTSSARWIILMWWLCHSSVTTQWDSVTTPSTQRFPGGIRLTAQETLMSVTSFFLIRSSKNVLPLLVVIGRQCGLVNTGWPLLAHRYPNTRLNKYHWVIFRVQLLPQAVLTICFVLGHVHIGVN